MNTEASTSGLGQNRPIPAGRKILVSTFYLVGGFNPFEKY